MSSPGDPLAALLDLVRTDARQGTAEALAFHSEDLRNVRQPLLDKRALAHALGVSTATVDRLCRQGRMPFVIVGEVRRFDLEVVRAALGGRTEGAPVPSDRTASERAQRRPALNTVRCLSRESRE